LGTPVPHLRDLRSELLLKLVLCDLCDVDRGPLLARQRERVVEMCTAIDAQVSEAPADVVALWRSESCHAALRFLDRVHNVSDTV
jgi:PadR family transcriptional regulator AphA